MVFLTLIFSFADGVAGGGAAGPAEEAQRGWRRAGQILRVFEGCPGEAGASREKSSRRKENCLGHTVERQPSMQQNTSPNV